MQNTPSQLKVKIIALTLKSLYPGLKRTICVAKVIFRAGTVVVILSNLSFEKKGCLPDTQQFPVSGEKSVHF